MLRTKSLTPISFLALALLLFPLFTFSNPSEPQVDISVSGTVDGNPPVISKSPTTQVIHPFPAEITLSGMTSPNSLVVIKMNGSVAGTTVSDSGGDFQRSIKSMVGGTYDFEIYSRDSVGRLSSTFHFTTSLLVGRDTLASGIHLSPTISAVPVATSRGEILYAFGQAHPESLVRVFLISGHDRSIVDISEASSGSGGNWLASWNTQEMPPGRYYVAAFAVSPDGRHSAFSHAVTAVLAGVASISETDQEGLEVSEPAEKDPSPKSPEEPVRVTPPDPVFDPDDPDAYAPVEVPPYEIVFPEDTPQEPVEERKVGFMFYFILILILILLLILLVRLWAVIRR